MARPCPCLECYDGGGEGYAWTCYLLPSRLSPYTQPSPIHPLVRSGEALGGSASCAPKDSTITPRRWDARGIIVPRRSLHFAVVSGGRRLPGAACYVRRPVPEHLDEPRRLPRVESRGSAPTAPLSMRHSRCLLQVLLGPRASAFPRQPEPLLCHGRPVVETSDLCPTSGLIMSGRVDAAA